jgi:hypothetical protein
VSSIAEQLAGLDWDYAEQDLSAFDEIGRRVATVGRAKDLITYSKLVEGIVFRLRTVGGGHPINLGVPDWIDLHRAILGNFLGRLCLATYERGAFMGSALVVSANGLEPSEGFLEISCGAWDYPTTRRARNTWHSGHVRSRRPTCGTRHMSGEAPPTTR